MPPPFFTPESSPSDLCHWIITSLRDIRQKLKPLDEVLVRDPRGSFHHGDDSMPDLEFTWGGAGGWRCQPIPRLHLMLEGSHRLTFVRREQTETVQLEPGDIWFLPADAHDAETYSTSCLYAAVIFHTAFTRFIVVRHETATEAGTKDGAAVRRIWTFHWNEPPRQIALTLAALTETLADTSGGDTAGLHLARGLWLQLWNWLHQKTTGPAPTGKAHASWLGIDRFLQENYHRPLNRKVVARAVGLHPNRISALCAEFHGKSFQQILEERRIKQAMRFLGASEYKIEAISAFCGYTSAAYFSRIFRQATGLSPGQWRLEHQTNAPAAKTAKPLKRTKTPRPDLRSPSPPK